MALDSGAKLSPYKVLSTPGAGGIGEVDPATDTRLQSQVAIKALPSAISVDSDRLPSRNDWRMA